MSLGRALVVALATIALLGAPSSGNAKGPGGGKREKAAKWSGSGPKGWSRGVKTGWKGGTTPPGWSKGRKVGWGGNAMPPGLFARQ